MLQSVAGLLATDGSNFMAGVDSGIIQETRVFGVYQKHGRLRERDVSRGREEFSRLWSPSVKRDPTLEAM